MILIKSLVKVQPPFNEKFPKIYRVVKMEEGLEGGAVYFLEDEESGFAEKFLEVE